MYISISYDGKFYTGGTPKMHVEGNVYLDSYGGIVLEINDSDSKYYYHEQYVDSEYELGKIKRIGDTHIDYYCEKYVDSEYELGKIKRIGDTHIDYYCEKYVDSENELGRVKRIGDYRFHYDEYGKCRIDQY